MNAINFTANLVDNRTIKQRQCLFTWKPVDVSIVELDSKNAKDIKALGKTSKIWERKGAKYVDHILYNIVPHLKIGFADIKDHYYALTTQKQNFEKLNSHEILGLMMFREQSDEYNEISFLEVNPSTRKSKGIFREYKQVGKALIDFVKSKFPQKDIEVWADCGAINFYKKTGFKQKSGDISDLCWRAAKKVC